MATRDSRGKALTKPEMGNEAHKSDSIEDTMDAKLEMFEKLVDKNDPEQMKMLEDMREHTRRLHQIRGDWNRPSSFRSWNDPVPKNVEPKKPLSVESYREYKNHKIQESHPLELVAQGIEPKLLKGEDVEPKLLKAGNDNVDKIEPRQGLVTR